MPRSSAVAVDSEGNIAVADELESSRDFGTGQLSVASFVLERDAACKRLWAKLLRMPCARALRSR